MVLQNARSLGRETWLVFINQRWILIRWDCLVLQANKPLGLWLEPTLAKNSLASKPRRFHKQKGTFALTLLRIQNGSWSKVKRLRFPRFGAIPAYTPDSNRDATRGQALTFGQEARRKVSSMVCEVY